MKVNLEKFLKESGIDEPFYPGKRLVKSCRQPGEYKSHCVVFDWRNPDKIRVEVKAGLTGKDLVVQQLKSYPVSFQSPTYVEIEIMNDNTNKEKEDEEGKASGSGGSGDSRGFKKKSLSELSGFMSKAFSTIVEAKAPSLGKITEMVIMGKQIAEQAFEAVFESLTSQISHAKIAATDLLAHAGKFITTYTPPSFMKPRGNEDAKYKYDREKNADIGIKLPSLG
jgi:hypothetical protein